VREWVVSQFGPPDHRPLLLVDPDSVVDVDELRSATGAGVVVVAHDWFELRRAWERHGRHRHGGSRVVLVVRDPHVSADVDLPYDMTAASMVRRVRLPLPQPMRSALIALDDTAADHAVKAIRERRVPPIDALLTAAADSRPAPIPDGPAEFALALRLASTAKASSIRLLARERLTDALAAAMVAEEPKVAVVAEAWTGWLRDGDRSPWKSHVEAARLELTDLFLAGRLSPAEVPTEGVPSWALVGVVQPTVKSRVEALFASPPPPAKDLESWIRASQWWGEVRSALAQINPPIAELEERAWDWWHQTDESFLQWLRRSYGGELTRSWATWPRSLDKVQPFLARRRAASGRLLLVVLDGMGFAQWIRLRELVQPTIHEAGGVLAMLPTLTEVSRQAIAAATIPMEFSDSIRTTAKEPQRWATAWDGSGARTAWVRIDGARASELQAIPFDTADTIGVVLSITDELMHSNDLLGDVGLHAGIEGWARAGVLQSLLLAADNRGYETWLTADHGNLAVAKTKEPREGDFVERNGTRTRRYASKTLRDDSAVEGITWDDLPGYPYAEAERLLFAPGRTGWGPARLSHGGLSLDEVIVPLVRLEPKR
jgi:PglZ domain